MIPFDILISIEHGLRTLLSTCTHKELRMFWETIGIPREIFNGFYGAKPKATPGYHIMGPSKKDIIEGIVEEVNKQGSLGTLVRILDEAIKYGKTLASAETQQAVNSLEDIKMRIKRREVGVAGPDKEEKEPKIEEVEKDWLCPPPIERLKEQFVKLLEEANHQKRGYDFQNFLYELFDWSELKPLAPFQVTGEQIDGGFEFKGSTYLLEARCRNKPANESDLLVLSSRVQSRMEGTKGIFISLTGYSAEAISAFLKGRRPNIVLLDGKHLTAILEGRIRARRAADRLPCLLEEILRRASSTGEIYVSIESILGFDV